MSDYTSKKIFKLMDKWSDYQSDSWDRGKESVEFINFSQQEVDDSNSISFEPLVFNFSKKWQSQAKANAKNIELSL